MKKKWILAKEENECSTTMEFLIQLEYHFGMVWLEPLSIMGRPQLNSYSLSPSPSSLRVSLMPYVSDDTYNTIFLHN